ncbi:hypothetical protein RI367_001595 [Sorochytrium milnesiophthora]
MPYAGFHPPHAAWRPERVDPSSLTPREFYDRFVATRTPCILTKIDLHTAGDRWTLPYLRRVAGSEKVQVERLGPDGTFGTGQQRVDMHFCDFVDKLQGPEAGSYYLTTQYEDDGDDAGDEEQLAFRDAFPAPVPSLLADIPPVPPLLDTLALQQVNMWMGAAPDATNTGTSSGLHHDFADNMYVLLRGRKRFTVFSPRDAAVMYLHGDNTATKKSKKRGLRGMHVHANGLISYMPGIRSDGAHKSDVATWKLHGATAAAEAATDPDERDRLAAIVDELEEVVLDLPVEDNHEAVGQEPPSFSRIPAAVLHSNAHSSAFPKLASATKVTFFLEEGEMLYLPASWFHEVTSFAAATANTSGDTKVHMALNYWMHPPSTADYARPYEDAYWPTRWRALRRTLGARTRRQRRAAVRARDVWHITDLIPPN